ncbi:uncharacterized protein LOC130671680 [Microplitis mediator]|uniref:uncharacterized protein LOC130671680 n=1 Tax=Microplitis mediator TaxID=375433 RepID=UPI0025549BDA|nr:uncharacterized protein LOC130671680 [Microplitis mediator]
MTSRLRLLIFMAVLVLAVDVYSINAHRPRRSLAFRKGSTFFYRLNYKINSVAWTTIFAQASGFKVSWHLPDGAKQKRSVDHLHDDVKFLYDSHGFNGQSCLARNICEAMSYANRKDGVMAKILKLLARTSNTNCTHDEDSVLECQQYTEACPLQLISINGFPEY